MNSRAGPTTTFETPREEAEMRWYDYAALITPLIAGTALICWLISLVG